MLRKNKFSSRDIPPSTQGQFQPGERIERQELHCHACDRYVQFDVDMSLDGNHVLKCPNCGHEHCRVVKDGIITEDRWSQRNRKSYIVSTRTTTSSITSTFNTTTSSNYFLYSSWATTSSSSLTLTSL